jgi:hypothetical protein
MTFANELFRQLDRVGGQAEPSGRLESSYRTTRGTRERLRYITSAKTGSSVTEAAKLLNVPPATLRLWLGGGSPSPKAKARIDKAYSDARRKNGRPKSMARARKVLGAVGGDAWNVTNDDGDDRYYRPRRWDRFVDCWATGDISGADDLWDAIVDEWDYPEPWGSWRIIAVNVV